MPPKNNFVFQFMQLLPFKYRGCKCELLFLEDWALLSWITVRWLDMWVEREVSVVQVL